MSSAVHRYSLANPPPSNGPLTGRESMPEAEILEVQALQAEQEGNDSVCVQLMERAMQIRSNWAAALAERAQQQPQNAYVESANGHAGKVSEAGRIHEEYMAACEELYGSTERLVVKCNSFAVESFKRGDYDTAGPLLQYCMDLTADDAYPLREAPDRRCHLRGVTLNNLGCMQRRQGHFREALDNLKASMDTTGVESPVAYMNMSAILIQLRLSEEAAGMAQRAVELLENAAEDPALLAVAHHNLAMALEPVDPARCLREYQTAYQTACAAAGADSATAISVKKNWQRFQASTQRGTGGAASYNGPLSRSLPPTPAWTDDAARTADVDPAGIFPHPFVSGHGSGSGSAAGGASRLRYGLSGKGSQRASSPPRQLPKLSATTRTPPPRAPFAAGEAAVTAPAAARAPKPPPPTTRGGDGRTAKTAARPSPPPAAPVAAAAATATSSTNPRGRRAPAGSTPARAPAEAAASHRPRNPQSPPPAVLPPPPPRDSAAQERLRRFNAARSAREDRGGDDGGSWAATSLDRQDSEHSSGAQRRNERGAGPSTAQTVPAPGGNRAKLSPLRQPAGATLSATRPRPASLNSVAPPVQENNYMTKPLESGNTSLHLRPAKPKGKGSSPPPRALPPIEPAATTSATENAVRPPESSATAGLRGAPRTASVPVSLGTVPDVTQFERQGGNLVSYIADRLDMLLHDQEELERKDRSAAVIQRCFRCHRARCRVEDMRKQHRESEQSRHVQRHRAARQIQRWYRKRGTGGRLSARTAGSGSHQAGHDGYRSVRPSDTQTAAVKLQSAARSWLARRSYARELKRQHASDGAARCIQRWTRSVLARRAVDRRRAFLQATQRSAAEAERADYAAMHIQNCWRRHREQRRAHAALAHMRQQRHLAVEQHKQTAARTIQCAWRSAAARQRSGALRSERAAREAQRRAYAQARHAAVTLQAFARGIIARRRTSPALEAARARAARAIRDSTREHMAAATVQRAYRSHAARAEVARRRDVAEEANRAQRKDLVVRRLQRMGRGYMSRRAFAASAAALEAEAARYARQLAELQRLDAQRRAALTATALTTLSASEDDCRAEMEMAEGKARRLLTNAAASAPRALPAAPELAEEASADDSAMDTVWLTPPVHPLPARLHVPPPHTVDTASVGAGAAAKHASTVLEGFVRMIRARRTTADRQAAVMRHLRAVDAQDAVAHRQQEASWTISRFLRGATAVQAVRARAVAIQRYLDAQVSSERALPPCDTEERADEEAAKSRTSSASTSDTAWHKEHDVSSPTRPPSHHAVAEAEATPAESGAGPATTAAPAEEECEDLEAALAVLREKRKQQKAEEDRLATQRNDLEAARQAYKLKQISGATTTRELAPYRYERVDPRRFRSARAMEATDAPTVAAAQTAVDTSTAAAPLSSRQQHEHALAMTVYRVYRGHQARQHARRLSQLRDECLNARVAGEKEDGPVLDYGYVTRCAAALPSPHFVTKEAAAAPVAAAPLERVAAPAPANGPSEWPRAVLDGFVKMLRAREAVTARQQQTSELLRAAEEADRRVVAGEAIVHFMQLAVAKRKRRLRAASVEAHCAGMEDSDRRAVAAGVLEHFSLLVLARRLRTRRASAVRALLDTQSDALEGSPSAQDGAEESPAHRHGEPADSTRASGMSASASPRGSLSSTQCDITPCAPPEELAPAAGAGPFLLSTSETAGALDGFARVIRAKRVVAQRRRQVAHHLAALSTRDVEDEASRTVTRFLRQAAAKGRRAHRLRAIHSASEHRITAEKGLSPLPSSRPQSSQLGVGGTAPRRPSTSALVETERELLAALTAKEHEFLKEEDDRDMREESQQLMALLTRERQLASEMLAEDADDEAADPTDAVADDVEDAAARAIQRVYRQHMARQELGALRYAQYQRLETELMAEELLSRAATDVQRVYRGHLARRLTAAMAQQLQAYMSSLAARTGVKSEDENEFEELGGAGAASSISSSANTAPGGSRACTSTLPHASSTDSESGSTGDGLTEREVNAVFPRTEAVQPAASAQPLTGTHIPPMQSWKAYHRHSSDDNSSAAIEEVDSDHAALDYSHDEL